MRPLRRSRRGGAARRRAQRGVAFILVLWVIAMLSILLASFAMVARTENLQSRHLFDTTRARYAAEAGLNLAVYELRKADPALRWIADGRPYTFGYGDAEVEVRITDDTGKIDLNAAAQSQNTTRLQALLAARGVEPERAEALAEAIVDWVDADDLSLPNGAELAEYKAAGLAYGPRNAPFDTVSELQQVLGMDYELFERLEPSLTIYSGRADPNAFFAPLETLQAMYPEASVEELQALIEQRQALSPAELAATEVMTPDGNRLVAGGGGVTYSVKSRARFPGGRATTLDATIRMGGITVGGRPYVILRWRDGDSS